MIVMFRYYQSSKTINEFALENGVFDWGGLQQFTWNVKVEVGNMYADRCSNVDETLGSVEVGRIVDEIGGNARGEIAKFPEMVMVISLEFILEMFLQGHLFPMVIDV